MTADELRLLAGIDGDDPSDEFVAQLRAQLHDELDTHITGETGAPIMVSIEHPHQSGPRLGWIWTTAAVVAAIVVGGLVVINGGDDSEDGPSATTVTRPTIMSTTTTTSSTTTTIADPAVDPPAALRAIIAAVNAGDVSSAMALVASDGVLDSGPLGWNGSEVPTENFEFGIDNLAELDGSITVRACILEDPPRLLCDIQLDHAGYQALGGPADAELEVEVTDGLITYWKLSNDSRYNDMRAVIVAAETEAEGGSFSVVAANCTDWRFNNEGCGDMILRHLEALRDAADS